MNLKFISSRRAQGERRRFSLVSLNPVSGGKRQSLNHQTESYVRPAALFRMLAIAAVLTTCALSGGCGYHMGSIMHPQIKSIAIGPVKNNTKAPFLSAYMRQSLCEQFQFDNSLKVKGLKEADCVLYGKVTKIETHGVMEDSSDNQQTYRASEWQVRVTFEFAVIVPGKKKLLVNNREVVGTAKFQVMADQAVTKVRGFQQACRDAAQQAVVYTVEAW